MNETWYISLVSMVILLKLQINTIFPPIRMTTTKKWIHKFLKYAGKDMKWKESHTVGLEYKLVQAVKSVMEIPWKAKNR